MKRVRSGAGRGPRFYFSFPATAFRRSSIVVDYLILSIQSVPFERILSGRHRGGR
jgi:hypothetical protein